MSATKVKSSFFAIGRILIDLYRKRNFIIDKQFKGTVYCTELYLYLSMYALIYQSSEHLLEGFWTAKSMRAKVAITPRKMTKA